jgi:hypothetical protein
VFAEPVDDPDGAVMDTVANVEDAKALPVADANGEVIDTVDSSPDATTMTDA